MRVLIIVTLVALAVVEVLSTPLDRGVHHEGVKGGPIDRPVRYPVKGGPVGRPPRYPVKGEYICGDKICRLKPGEIPAGCDKHPCQYPIL